MHQHLLPNTFGFDARCSAVYFINENTQIHDLPNQLLTVGEGSNLLFVDDQIDVPIAICQHQTFDIEETDSYYHVTLGAGLNWHEVVLKLIKLGVYGLENLALIPGTVGAAPVQNIGAYGVELADFCQQVSGIDLAKAKRVVLDKEQCQFSYRDSVFKASLKTRFVIESITLSFPKKWQPCLTYGPLESWAKVQVDKPTSAQICQYVISIRQTKLPDPKQLGNAGSFFKNPIIDKAHAQALKASWPDMPIYPIDEKLVKVAAGYLIDRAGLKGYQHAGVGVHKNQALVLVNYGQGSADELVSLANQVIETVNQKFAIKLVPEVRFISARGEIQPSEVLA
ncbi:UDP-N-acetylmuramate dehydrogenase [Catenovulum sp. SM1970]|uniref:UDP-N-acetylmuramate dehydrogenase n=1 Tax=Marinifaba aquimaris TaxID=2741323 RepID=UPI0015731696|nr:UDP-N-acetylmuramate dehydrogenase [Marinifaba aquimaris]NTS78734.1 UDP-N-acetylmuramate dehydrogenase [Marinifaba aquimaris]